MTKIEKTVVNAFKENSVFICFLVVTVIGLIVRWTCRDFVSADASRFLLPWYEEIGTKGFRVLGEQIGDYNILYQFLIYLFTLLPISPLYAYKVFSVIFDYALALMVGTVADDEKSFMKRLSSERFVVTYSAVLLSPLVFLNSSCWAQCDSIYVFFIFAALYAFTKKKYTWMFILYGLSFAFKFQAIFALPFFVILYFLEMEFSIFQYLLIPAVFFVSGLPGFLMGRKLLDPLRVYYHQAKNNCGVWMNNHTIWNMIFNNWYGAKVDYHEYKVVTACVALVLLGLIALKQIKKKDKPDRTGLIELLHITAYTAVLFMPGMHDRYGYIYEITAILLIVLRGKKFLLPGVITLILSGMLYGYFMFGVEYDIMIISFINTLVYCRYAYLILFREEEKDGFACKERL